MTEKKGEQVNHPAHYGGKNNPYEVIKVIEAWGFLGNALRFNAIKYLARAGKKNKRRLLEDLKKGRWYLDREITALEKQLTKKDKDNGRSDKVIDSTSKSSAS